MEVTTNDDEEELEVPIFKCVGSAPVVGCGASFDARPNPVGRMQLVFRDDGMFLDTLAATKVVDLLAGGRPAYNWGQQGSEQRMALCSHLAEWVGDEYRLAVNYGNGKFFLNHIQKLGEVASKRARYM